MLRKLGKSITIVNAIAFIVVILVGGISIFLSQKILHNTHKIEKISMDIVTVDSIHSEAYRLVLSMHHFLLEEDKVFSKESMDLISGVTEKVERYLSYEKEELSSAHNPEVGLLYDLLRDVRGLKAVNEIMSEFTRTGKYNRNALVELEQYAYGIEANTARINKIHLEKINNATNESLVIMRSILFIYLIFIVIGGLAIYAGHRVLLRKVVNPIKDLAAATMEFARGTLNKRVCTDSQTEIGLLYQSFNKMAEKLQENDEFLRKFNEELEKKVNERTMELQNANEQLQKTQNALIRTEKIAAIGQIAAGVTHEIKNPLNSLSINAQLLLRDLSSQFNRESSAYESASLIRQEITRINNILEEFVKYAKFPEPQFVENNMNQVVKETVDLISHSAQEAHIAIQLFLGKNVPIFKFDERQFKEVLLNLFQNAIKAMTDGGNLEIVTDLQDESVILKIKDTGQGIPEKHLDKIFSPFFSTREGGLGLGLPIVQRIVESHGGRISCESKVGEGTIFEISIPLEKG
ncbi:MAG: HAMP domain-containing protein [Nitrospiraceae bacterium]|nr:MAG: HAMP domain-containing protein [Nitrospiraceae bacterium]